MRIGFFGGSFNPPSNIHIDLAKNVIEKYKLDRILFVPVGDYYNKDDLVSAKHRLNMLKLAIENKEKLEVEEIATNSKVNLYAIDTFNLITKKYKNNDIYFIMGSDNFRKMPTWHSYKELINNYNIIVIERERQEIRKQNRNNIHEFIPCSLYNVDSTKIRRMIKNNEPVKELLDDKVYKYIIDNNLYKE